MSKFASVWNKPAYLPYVQPLRTIINIKATIAITATVQHENDKKYRYLKNNIK